MHHCSGCSIYALTAKEDGRNIGLEIRDPERNRRRIGPPADLEHAGDDHLAGNDEEIFVSLSPKIGDSLSFEQAYTFATEERRGGLVHLDVWNLKAGKKYEVTLKRSRWRWMWKDEIEGDEKTAAELLWQEPFLEWKADCRVEFQAETIESVRWKRTRFLLNN